MRWVCKPKGMDPRLRCTSEKNSEGGIREKENQVVNNDLQRKEGKKISKEG